jgi:uncharacterized protein (TIGR00299 family) protein
MRIAYLDCFAGIAGDMMLGALIDAGVPGSVLERATSALNIGASLRIERVDRSGITATKVHVLEHGRLAESPAPTPTQSHEPQQQQQSAAAHTHLPKTQHLHKAGHAHTHDHDHHEHSHQHDHAEPHHEASSLGHPHAHGRSLMQIRTLIQATPLDEFVKRLALRTFELLGASEAKIHNVPVDQIHFHEVGAVDAIVDIVASCAGIHHLQAHLQVGAWHSSPINVGGGMIQCAHGTFPVPAPATADLLRNVPTYSAHLQKELTTPTGAALIRALEPTFGPQPAMRVEQIGYGAGTRNPKGFPNVLRLSIGESSDTNDQPVTLGAPFIASSAMRGIHSANQDTVTVLETALDDASPQLLAYVAEKAFALGALDVMLAPVIMKKGRPGTLLTVLCRVGESDRIAQLLLRETTTLGLRIRDERRLILNRAITTVDTPYGRIRLKHATDPATGDLRNLAPEYEDCRAAAEQHDVPLKQVQQAAIAAYPTQP